MTDKAKKFTRESDKAWAQYEAEGRALRAKTERLRLLRLAKEAADRNAAPAPVLERKGRRKPLSAAAGKLASAVLAKEP